MCVSTNEKKVIESQDNYPGVQSIISVVLTQPVSVEAFKSGQRLKYGHSIFTPISSPSAFTPSTPVDEKDTEDDTISSLFNIAFIDFRSEQINSLNSNSPHERASIKRSDLILYECQL